MTSDEWESLNRLVFPEILCVVLLQTASVTSKQYLNHKKLLENFYEQHETTYDVKFVI